MGGKAAVEAAKAAGWDKVQAIAISGVQGDGTATAPVSYTHLDVYKRQY